VLLINTVHLVCIISGVGRMCFYLLHNNIVLVWQLQC